MSAQESVVPQVDVERVRARAKVLAREDLEMKADLVRVRRESGLTQADVAAIMGVTQQAVQKLERYESDPKLSTLRRYANAIGALVEHRVSPDAGQSVPLAVVRHWDTATTSSRTVPLVKAPVLAPSDWEIANRQSFALAV